MRTNSVPRNDELLSIDDDCVGEDEFVAGATGSGSAMMLLSEAVNGNCHSPLALRRDRLLWRT